MTIYKRLHAATRAAGMHFFLSGLVAATAATLVFGVWYSGVFASLAGGRELFLIVVCVDVVCGPLLTLVLFNDAKPRAELFRDLSLVVLIQVTALGYGLHTVWIARPLYLVQEIDRFRMIAAPDIELQAFQHLPKALQPQFLKGPVTIGIRPPKDDVERNTVLMESLAGGRDYSQRPEFYVPYTPEVGLRAAKRFKPLEVFLARYPNHRKDAEDMASKHGLDVDKIQYLPVVGRQDWVALLDEQAQIIGYLKGDGF